ncbi:ribonuclease H-like domain-containing protein [Tanacetum coccineum]
MAVSEPSGSNVLINNLDAGNPLHVQNSNNSSSVLIPFKLLAGYASSDVLSAQWDKCNAIVLTWIMNSVSYDVYMSLVYSDNYAFVWEELQETYDKVNGLAVYNLLQKINTVKQGGSIIADYYHRLNSLWREFDALTKLPKCTCEPVESALFTRDPLPDAKDAYNTVSREESHRGVRESSGVSETKMNATSFAAKFKKFANNAYSAKQPYNANVDVKCDKQASISPYSSGFTPEQMKKLLSQINDNGSGVNQHLTVSTVGMFSVVDIVELCRGGVNMVI